MAVIGVLGAWVALDSAQSCPAGYKSVDPVEVAREFRGPLSDTLIQQIRERFGDSGCLWRKAPESLMEFTEAQEARTVGVGKYTPTLTVTDDADPPATSQAKSKVAVSAPAASPARRGGGALGWLTLLPLLAAALRRRGRLRRPVLAHPLIGRSTDLLTQPMPADSRVGRGR